MLYKRARFEKPGFCVFLFFMPITRTTRRIEVYVTDDITRSCSKYISDFGKENTCANACAFAK